ncbi:MAG: copper homeostasis protein [Paraglaciecola sp.]|jgi:copper homeostasis protein
MEIFKEACVETYEQAILAQKNGVNRIELCGDLSVGGVTPDFALTQRLLVELTIPIRVMVRPRGGNFVYSTSELEEMKTTILTFKKMEVEGVVFGILKEDNTINLNENQTLANLAKPLKVTFHKAIDTTNDILGEFSKLLKISEIDTVLTSGGKPTALEGMPILKEMIKLAGDKITILSAGKITNENLSKLHQKIGGTAYHGRKIVGNLTV